MAADPQTLAREMVVELDHPVAGRTRALGVPVKFGATPGSIGQHTREILQEHVFSATEIAALAADEAIQVTG